MVNMTNVLGHLGAFYPLVNVSFNRENKKGIPGFCQSISLHIVSKGCC